MDNVESVDISGLIELAATDSAGHYILNARRDRAIASCRLYLEYLVLLGGHLRQVSVAKRFQEAFPSVFLGVVYF